jgi:hypothetical protein
MGDAVMRSTWALAAAAAGVCAAVGAPAGLAFAEDDETPQQVINRLQSQGYTVTIDKIGTAPIDQCVVTSIRNPQTTGQLVPYVGPGTGSESFLVPVVNQSISVSLVCPR